MKLPFFAKYPYTNFEQLNIDWLLEKIGGFDERIRSNTERITLVEGRCDVIETRLDGHDEDIADLKQRMTTAEGDIDSLEGRMDTAEGDIDSLEGRMDTAEGDIDSLEGRMDTAEDDIDICEADIIDLKNKDAAIEDMIASQYDSSNTYHAGDYAIYNDILYKCTNTTSGDFDFLYWQQVNVTNEIKSVNDDLDSLSSEVDAIPVVTPNPGGSGTNLNTIQIGDTIYVVPSGGGGGGSSVTPNPAGAATDVLNKVDIDGTIFAMPSDVEANPAGSGTADLTKLKVGSTIYDIPQLTVDNALDGTSSNPIANSAVTDAINDVNSDFAYDRAASNVSIVNDASWHVIKQVNITPGLWLIRANSPISMNGIGEYGIFGIAISKSSSYSDVCIDSINWVTMNENAGVGTHSITAKTDTILEVNENTTIYVLGYLSINGSNIDQTTTRYFQKPTTTILKLK